MIQYMSEKYYREINTNKDIIKFKLQLGAILLKLNEHNSNVSNIKDDITKYIPILKIMIKTLNLIMISALLIKIV